MVAWELEVEFSDSSEDDGEQYGAVVVDDVVVVVVKVVGEVEEVVCNFLCLSMIFPKSCDGLGKMLRLVS